MHPQKLRQQKPKPHRHMIVAGAMILRDNHVLVCRRNDPRNKRAHNKWEFPGGKVETGETLEAALEREVQEEVACSVTIAGLIPYVVTNSWQFAEGELRVFFLAYLCALKQGEPKPATREISEVRWITKEEARSIDGLPGLRRLINMGFSLQAKSYKL